jgi:hypothetical protein
MIKYLKKRKRLKQLKFCNDLLNEFLKSSPDGMRRVHTFKTFINAKIMNYAKPL